MISIPLFLTIHQLVYLHDVLFSKYDFIHSLYVILRIGLILFISWSVPSAFTSSVANFPSFIIGNILARSIFCISNMTVAYFDLDARLQLLTNSFLLLAPIGNFKITSVLWIVAMIQANYARLILICQIGIAADILVAMLLEVFTYYFTVKRREKYLQNNSTILNEDIKFSILFKRNWDIEQNSRWGLFTLVLILSTAMNIFPLRNTENFPAFLLTVPFSSIQFIFGALVLLFIMSMYKLVEYGRFWCKSKPVDDNISSSSLEIFMNYNLVSFLIGRSITLLYLLIYSTIAINSSSLVLTVSEIYTQYSGIPNIDLLLPYNMSIPIDSASLILQTSTGKENSYAQRAIDFMKSNYDNNLGSSRIFSGGLNSASIFLASSGLILSFTALLDLLLLGECDLKSLYRCWNRKLIEHNNGIINRITRFTLGSIVFISALLLPPSSLTYNISAIVVMSILYFAFSVVVVLENIFVEH